jgi:phosphodiesterase/alkaline phosphatase D-like protein
MVVAWQTLAGVADFDVDFGATERYEHDACCEQRPRASTRGGETDRLNWTATIDGLSPGRQYFYRVRGDGLTLAEGYFTTWQPRGRRVRFVSFGDNSYGDISDRAIAYHTYRQHPDFVMNCGDNVYECGTDDEY